MAKKFQTKILVTILSVLLGVTGCQPEPSGDYTSIVGIYSCHEASVHEGFRNYIVEIQKVKQETDVYIIANFHNQGDNEFIYAVLENDSLFISGQIIQGLTINGKGKVAGDLRQIELEYTTYDRVYELDYTAVYER